MSQPSMRKTGGRPGAGMVRWAVVSATACLLGLSMTASAGAAKAFSGRITQVSDGDTVWVLPDRGGPPRKLRLDGMDAPELCQPEGPAAREVLAAWALRRHVEVTVRRYDDYGRGLARIRLDGQDLGARMVREGHAWSYRYRRDPGPYLTEENEARARQRGLFRQAAPEVPRAFRQRHGPCPMPPFRRGD